MKSPFLIAALLLLGGPPASSSSSSAALFDYLSAIDLPLSPEHTVRIGGKSSELRAVVLDNEQPLYSRSMALAAYAQIPDFQSLDWLTVVADAPLPLQIKAATKLPPLPRPLRRQAVISIAEIYGPIAPAQVSVILIELMPSMPWNNADLLKRLRVWSVTERAKTPLTDSE